MSEIKNVEDFGPPGSGEIRKFLLGDEKKKRFWNRVFWTVMVGLLGAKILGWL